MLIAGGGGGGGCSVVGGVGGCWMGLTIRGFGGLVLLRWQWFDPVLFLVVGCWVFDSVGSYMDFMRGDSRAEWPCFNQANPQASWCTWCANGGHICPNMSYEPVKSNSRAA